MTYSIPKGAIPESWNCVDCGVNTAPGLYGRAMMEAAIAAIGVAAWEREGVEQTYDDQTEVYTVREAIWKRPAWIPMAVACASAVWSSDSVAQTQGFPPGRCIHQVPTTPRLIERQGRR
jgi:hypothetical protein